MPNTRTIENALELCAHRCDMATFRNFLKRTEQAIDTGLDLQILEQQIMDAVNASRSRAFNISNVANDETMLEQKKSAA